MLRRFGKYVERTVLEGVGRATSQLQEHTPLAVDLLESEESFLAVFDAPGVQSEDVDVRFDDAEVRVEIYRSRDISESVELLMRGRGLRRSGSVTLPSASVDPDAATATLTASGTLRVRIPKTEPGPSDEPIRIETTAGEGEEGDDGDDQTSDPSPAAG